MTTNVKILLMLLLFLAPVLWFGFSLEPVKRYLERDESTTFVKTYPYVALENIWFAYRSEIQKDGRTIDIARNYLTTSEGQSYSLLRAVWMGDKETFDKVLKWTNANLRKRPDDSLFAWKWGEDANGSWGVLNDEGGLNSASDADQDIALALIFAYKRWNEEDYLTQAKELLRDIWSQEVILINNRPYLVAGNWASQESRPTINPSYFSPASYPIFAEVDPVRPWLELKDTSYEILEQSTENPFFYENSGYLPPDWVSIDRTTGTILVPTQSDKTIDFADDALRIPWRVGLDYLWHNDPRAKAYLEKLSRLKDDWVEKKVVFKAYEHNGNPKAADESVSMYAGVLPYFDIVFPELAEEIYFKKLVYMYDPDTEGLKFDLGYYDKNWIWFGMAFYQKRLPNLYKEV